MVQEGNYLSQSRHIWQGDTPKTSAHTIRIATSGKWDHPQLGFWRKSPLAVMGAKQNSHVPPIGSWTNSPLGIRSAKTLIKRPRRVENTTFKV